jgi:hypothetical protein
LALRVVSELNSPTKHNRHEVLSTHNIYKYYTNISS